jgi:hypothetical protein
MVKIGYHAARILFGAWFLFSGSWHFLWPWLQPMGSTPEAVAFTRALMASGLFGWIKAIEVLTGLLILANRAMPLAIVAVIPLNIVILYWNLVLDRGAIDWTFGLLTILFTAAVVWPWRVHFWPLFVWRGRADYRLDPLWPAPAAAEPHVASINTRRADIGGSLERVKGIEPSS